MKLTYHGIELEVFVDTYADGDYDINNIYVVGQDDPIPGHVLSSKAEEEICTMIGKLLDTAEPELREPDERGAPEYFFRGVRC
jgi:hypothetical protein